LPSPDGATEYSGGGDSDEEARVKIAAILMKIMQKRNELEEEQPNDA
jgi:hypothetical protein